ncbi:MAG: roadblock/LC7 domain-containing protein [Sorangiineae bacterium]|nr:roadblock/LC7 domain-containing protein [Polyangiaceae bacterium]MEB2323075.1 roadblock/LC7 domain-containing protein [Sorangiineae bacterium]
MTDVHEHPAGTELAQIDEVIGRLVKKANAIGAFLIDRAGQVVSANGDLDELDSTSLASLTAGNVAATDGIGKLLLAGEFSAQFHEGKDTHVHIRLVGKRVILVVIFGTSSSLGLVRLRAREAGDELDRLFALLIERQHSGSFEEISDGDLEDLFN